MKKIVVDSSCDISNIRLVYDENNQLVQFDKAALTIHVGEKEYIDDKNLDIKDMMDTMKAYDGASSSACPGPAQWKDCFEGADEIYVITITSALSGAYSSAMVAKQMELEEHPEKKIQVIDSLSTGPEMTLLVQQILYQIQKGNDFDTICKNVVEYQKHTKLAFVLHSIDNLVKNGRVSKLTGFAANLLGIIVVGRANENGELEMISKGRGGNKTNSAIVQEMKAQGYQGGSVNITHCFNEKDAKKLRDSIWKEFPNAQITIAETGGLCSYYAELGGILIGYETVEKSFSLANLLSHPEKVPSKA